jgi:hypothetical protein
VAGLALLATAVAIALAASGAGRTAVSGGTSDQPSPPADTPPTTPPPTTTPQPGPALHRTIGLQVVTYIDRARLLHLPHRRVAPRTLVTYVRYPALSAAAGTDVPGAAPDAAGGPYPLIVFGHGFDVTPGPYTRLMRAWARAGYVVAAPVFPLGNHYAPGGADENDIVNQPGDMSLVISQLIAAGQTPGGPFSGLVDPRRITVAGQSDGGETALAVAYDKWYRDPRVGAAVILSGARIPGGGGLRFGPGSPPLLATQGTADRTNQPRYTYQFYAVASRPKFLLSLLGAGHLPPYTYQQPQLGIVERTTIAFLDRYMKDQAQASAKLATFGNLSGIARLTSLP